MGVAKINKKTNSNKLVSVRGTLTKLYDAIWTGGTLHVSTSPTIETAPRPITRYVPTNAATITSYTADPKYCKLSWEGYLDLADAPGSHASLVLHDSAVAMAHAVLPDSYLEAAFPHGSAVSYSTSEIDWKEYFHDGANPPNGNGTFEITISAPPPLHPAPFPYSTKMVISKSGVPGVAEYYLAIDPLIYGSNTLVSTSSTDDTDVELLKLLSSGNFNIPLTIAASFGNSHTLLLSGSDVGTQGWAQGLYFDSNSLTTTAKPLELSPKTDPGPSHPSGAGIESTANIYISTCKSAHQNSSIYKLAAADRSTLINCGTAPYTDFRGPMIDFTTDRHWYIINGTDPSNATTQCALCEYLTATETWGTPVAASTNPVAAYNDHDTSYIVANQQGTLTNKFWGTYSDNLFLTYGDSRYIEWWDVSGANPIFIDSLDAIDPIYALHFSWKGLYAMTANKLLFMDPAKGETSLRDVSHLWPSDYATDTSGSTNHQDYVILTDEDNHGPGYPIVFSLRGRKIVYTTSSLYYASKAGVGIAPIAGPSPEEYQIPECGSGGGGKWVDPLSIVTYRNGVVTSSSVDVASGVITLAAPAGGDVITHDYKYTAGLTRLARGPASAGYRASSTAYGVTSSTISGDYQYIQGYEYVKSFDGIIFSTQPTTDTSEVVSKIIPTEASGVFFVGGGMFGNLKAQTRGTTFVVDDYYATFSTVTGLKTNVTPSTLSYDFHTMVTSPEQSVISTADFSNKMQDVREHLWNTSGITFSGEARVSGSYFEVNGSPRVNAYMEQAGSYVLDTATQFDIDSEIIIDLGTGVIDDYNIVGINAATANNGVVFEVWTSTALAGPYVQGAGTMSMDKFLMNATSNDRYVKLVFKLISPIGETSLRINKITVANAAWTVALGCTSAPGFLMIDCGNGASEPMCDHSTEGVMSFYGDDIFIEPPVGSFCIDPIFGFVRMNDTQPVGNATLDYYWLET